ncbi:hypothetical protein Dsin_002347 [Dipteronia sinensis]|uniref:Uncharacterized protein n=1 Tax=Dipteronia sinensis TaxID=43782 RepID=A0AAE0EJB5_9ROSI|nr:hypothetical protein Dsin_002347 [Dipteronia sinensis]
MLFSRTVGSDCRIIRRILECYFGQIINFDKSVVCFSKAVPKEEGHRLAAVIDVCHVRCHEKYLGLPSFATRNKHAMFNDIKDRIWKKIKGWRCKTMSVASKDVLIKSVLQSIPTYSMSLLCLPTSLILEIHGLCCKFWWGSTETSRKLHWASWHNLCKGKEAGEMGFRDLSVFVKTTTLEATKPELNTATKTEYITLCATTGKLE